MNKETLQYIVGLGQPMAEVVEIDGLRYEKSQHDIKLMGRPSVAPLEVTTLSGLVDYIKSDVDLLPNQDDEWIIAVSGHDRVSLKTQLSDGYLKRETYVEAKAGAPGFDTGTWMDVEDFIISLQARMLDDGDKALLIAFCSSIQDAEDQTIKDTGVSQSITAKVGITTQAQVNVPNPVRLAPFRTFCDVAQPISSFIFRVRKGARGPQCGLFEADGGAWKADAIQIIAGHLREKLADYTTRKVHIIA